MGKVVVLDKSAFRKRIERISNLPTLPNLLQKFNEMIKDPKISMDTLGKELSKDQVITSKLLKLVNSAFYGFPGRISTISHALVLLGYDALKGLIITSSIFENLSPTAYPLWRHSIAVSLTSRKIATKLSLQDREEFAVAGLLHDIGKVILHMEAPQEYRAVVDYAR
jgi:HD-like signal output (HDOD) protein